MEKEQIVKALECCAATSAEACRECPVDQSIKDDCRCCSFLAGNALGIIREQEKQIAEFSATVERRECVIRLLEQDVRDRDRLLLENVEKVYPKFVRDYKQALSDLEAAAPPQDLVSIDAVREAIKRYCHKLIDEGKDLVEVTEFNADLQRILDTAAQKQKEGNSYGKT